jgi:phage gp46-like protein
MSDFSFRIKNDSDLFADMEISEGDFLLGNELETSTTISVFSDRRADDDEFIRYSNNFQRPPLNRGAWFDTFRETIIGSGLWLLSREKRLDVTRVRAESYAEDSLQWLIRDGVCKSVDVTAEFDGEVLKLDIVLTKQDEESITLQYAYVWESGSLGVNAVVEDQDEWTPEEISGLVQWLEGDDL